MCQIIFLVGVSYSGYQLCYFTFQYLLSLSLILLLNTIIYKVFCKITFIVYFEFANYKCFKYSETKHFPLRQNTVKRFITIITKDLTLEVTNKFPLSSIRELNTPCVQLQGVIGYEGHIQNP